MNKFNCRTNKTNNFFLVRFFLLLFFDTNLINLSCASPSDNTSSQSKLPNYDKLQKVRVNSVCEIDNNSAKDSYNNVSDKTNENLIGYQQRLFRVTGTGLHEQIVLIPVRSNFACQANFQLDAIQVGHGDTILLKVNVPTDEKQLNNIFLCAFDKQHLDYGKHLGEESLFVFAK